MRVGILTASDTRTAAGDESGRAIAELVATLDGAQIVASEIVADDAAALSAALVRLADEVRCDVVLTTGGTGVAPRDVTPEATVAVCDRLVPGLAEAMRAASLAKTPMAMLSRATAGLRGRTLIINLPGSPKAVRECLAVVLPVLPHAVDLAGGGKPH